MSTKMRNARASNQTALEGLSDAKLIGLVIERNDLAFDCLVRRHRKSVLNAAWSVVGNWDQAEDAAQRALLLAFTGLRGLRDRSKFRSWLITITRRQAMRLRTSEPQHAEFCEMAVGAVSQPSPVTDDLRDRVKASLSELSSRNRQVVTLHYLDGYSCREIGERLGISEGAVKRILYESRNRIRAAVEVTRSTGGETRMKKQGPRELVWWINGQWPGPVMDGLLRRAICLAANKKARTLEEIAEEVDANVRFIEEAIEPLVREDLVTRTKAGRYLTNFVALDAEDWIEIIGRVRGHGTKVANFLERHLSELEDAWNKTSLPDKGFPWSEGIWPTLAIFVCNTGVSRKAPHSQPAPVRESGKEYWAGGHEMVPPEHVPWNTGFNNRSPSSGRIGYGYHWSYGHPRLHIGPWDEERAWLLTWISQGITDIEAMAEKTRINVEQVRQSLAEMIEEGLLSREGDSFRLNLPVFDEKDGEILTPAVDAVAHLLSDEILEPATAGVADDLKRLGYGHLKEQFLQWRSWTKGYVCGEGLRALLERGLLPDPGDPAPARFCLVGWTEPMPLFSYR